MAALVLTKLRELCDEIRRGKTRDEHLPRVDANGTMLTSVVDLDEAPRKIEVPDVLRDCHHDA